MYNILDSDYCEIFVIFRSESKLQVCALDSTNITAGAGLCCADVLVNRCKYILYSCLKFAIDELQKSNGALF
jgi:hypothetical protein